MKQVMGMCVLSALLLFAGSAFAQTAMMGAGFGQGTGSGSTATYGPNMSASVMSGYGSGQTGATGFMTGFGQTASTGATDTQSWFQAMMPWLF